MSGVHGIAYRGGIEEVVTAHRLCASAAHLAERAGSPSDELVFAHADEELDFDDLARSLALNEWTPGPLSPIVLARQGGRLVHSASVVDRIVDRAVATAIAPVVDPLLSPLVFAYRKAWGSAVRSMHSWSSETTASRSWCGATSAVASTP